MTTKKAFSGRVFFDHLPKTAGTAISVWLRETLGLGCVTPTHLWGNHKELIGQFGGKYSVISAHTHFSNCEGLDPRYQYVTFLREPIDRAVSWLYFVINNHHEQDPLLGKTISQIKRFLDSEGQDIHPDLIAELSNVYLEHFCRIKGTGLECDESKYKNAIQSIKEYDVVGVYSNMPKFLAEFAGLIGLPPPREIDRVHVTVKKPNINAVNEKIINCLKNLNKLDLKLYAEIVNWKNNQPSMSGLNGDIKTEPQWEKYEPTTCRDIFSKDLKILYSGVNGVNIVKQGQIISFHVDFQLLMDIDDLEIGIHIYDSYNRLAFGINNRLLGQEKKSITVGIYQATYHLIADLPVGNYTVGFAFVDYSNSKPQELAWHDVLCNFEVQPAVNRNFAGYAYLSPEINLFPKWLSMDQSIIIKPSGKLLSISPISKMEKGSHNNIEVEVTNESLQKWKGDIFRPINLSYHWKTMSEEDFIFDGLRTSLPLEGIEPFQSLQTNILVEAPAEPGVYILILTLVQEYVGWFEENGFDAARLIVDVF